MTPIRLVVFDVGSVLVDAGRSWQEDAARAGFPPDVAWWEEFERRLAALPSRTRGEIDNESFLRLFVEASRGRFSIEDARRITAATLGSEYPGVDHVFDALAVAGVATAALCNLNDADWRHLFDGPDAAQEYPSLARMQHRFGSHELSVAKPDPGAYRAVEAGTAIAPESILFFDDRIENVEAARERGWTAERVDPRADPPAQILGWLRYHEVIS